MGSGRQESVYQQRCDFDEESMLKDMEQAIEKTKVNRMLDNQCRWTFLPPSRI